MLGMDGWLDLSIEDLHFERDAKLSLAHEGSGGGENKSWFPLLLSLARDNKGLRLSETPRTVVVSPDVFWFSSLRRSDVRFWAARPDGRTLSLFVVLLGRRRRPGVSHTISLSRGNTDFRETTRHRRRIPFSIKDTRLTENRGKHHRTVSDAQKASVLAAFR